MSPSRSRAFVAPVALLLGVSCGGGSGVSTDTAPATPTWGEAAGPAHAVLAVPTPELSLVGDPALRAVWYLPPDRTFEWVARPLPASRIALPVPPIAAGRYAVDVFQGTRLVARGDVLCGGVDPVPDPEAEVHAWISTIEARVDGLRGEVLDGALPGDLADFLDIAALQAGDARALLPTLPADEVVALGNVLGANTRLRLLLGDAGPLPSAGTGCPERTNTAALDALESAPTLWAEVLTGTALGVDVLAGTGTTGVGGLVGGALGLTCILDVHGRVHTALGEPVVELAGAHRTCGLDVEVQVAEPFTVVLAGDARGVEEADSAALGVRIGAAAAGLESAFTYLRNTTGWVVAALGIAPGSVPARPVLPAASTAAECRFDAAHVTWIEATGASSGALSIASDVLFDGGLALTLAGGIPGERVEITYGYHHAGVGPVSAQAFTVRLAD